MSTIIRPIITEKTNAFAAAEKAAKVYGFVVGKDATKAEIKSAIEGLYGVTVNEVNTLIARGKTKARYTKTGVVTGRKSNFKKAYVTLADGQELDFYKTL